MKKTYRKAFLLMFLFFNFVGAVNAGDYSTLNFIGFSKDGKFVAFEEYGIQDGSGFPYSNYYFVNVEKNSFASPSYQLLTKNESVSLEITRNKAKTATTKTLDQLKIVRGNTGKQVISRLLTDLSVNGFREDLETGSAEDLRFAEEVGSNYEKGVHRLVLTATEAKSNCQADEFAKLKFELTLEDEEKRKKTTLQKDESLPKARECAYMYRINDVYVYQNFIAVFIGVFGSGFEGANMRYIVVTGKLR